MRIWQKDFNYRPIDTPELLDTEHEYFRFKKNVIFEGFKSICKRFLPLFSDASQCCIKLDENIIGYFRGEYAFLLKSRIPHKYDYNLLNREFGITYILTFTDKYDYTGLQIIGDKLTQRFKGKKPKNLCIVDFSLV